MNSQLLRRIAALTALAGTALPAAAQNDPSSQPGHDPIRNDRTSNPAHRNRNAREAALKIENDVDFRSSAWIDDREVVNTEGQTIGKVHDFILDRGSGKIDQVIVRSGTVLGLGGKDVVLPYDQFRWDENLEKLQLDMTREELQNHPEFSADEWKRAMGHDKDGGPLRDRLSGKQMRDPFDRDLQNARATTIEGEVVNVDREREGDNGEQVRLTVREESGREHRVLLGPSWYIGSGPVTPMRGQHVTVEGLVPGEKGGDLVIARIVRIDGRELVLRDKDNQPRWMADERAAGGDGHEPTTTARRYILMSSLVGSDVDCRGVDCGKVHDVIIERNSGEIAFLSIDPDDNFLGIGDTRRLVPWQVATVFVDGDVHIDANREMVLASPETPDDLTTLNRAEMVYRAFGVEPPAYKPVARAGQHTGRWRPIYASMDRSSRTTMSGTVVDTTTVRLNDELPSAKVLRIRTDEGERVILLGPSATTEKHVLPDRNESIVIEAYRASVDGKPYWIAQSVTVDGQRVTLLEETGDLWNPDR